jgi:O-antigen/teichoic acid export membrane protein
MNLKLNKAILRSISGKFSQYVVQLILLIIYARVFSPEQFGLVASIFVFITFFLLLTDVGIGPALINEGDVTPGDLNGAFSFTILIGVVVSLIVFIMAPYISSYYENQELLLIVYSAIPCIFFSCLTIIPYTCCVKDLYFIRVSILDSISHLITLSCVIFLIDFINPTLALAMKMSIYCTLRFLMLLILSRYTSWGMPQVGFSFQIVTKIKRFASYQFGFGIINYIARNLDNILVAKFLGSAKLGVYDQAYQLMKYPLQLTSFALSSAIQPVLSEYKNNKMVILTEHNKLAEKLICLSVVLCTFISTNANSIVNIILGEQWSGVIILIQILNLSLPFQMVMATSGGFFQSLGRPELLFKAGLLGAGLFAICIVTSIYWGSLEAVAWGISIAFVLNSISVYKILFYEGFENSPKDFICAMLSAVYRCVPYIIIYYINDYFLNLLLSDYVFINSFLSLLIPLSLFYKFFIRVLTEKEEYKKGDFF